MLASLQIELGDTILCTSQDDLRGVNAFDICCHSKRLLRVDYASRIRAFDQINDVQFLVVYVLDVDTSDFVP